jgi:hypothetical protein
MAKIVEDIIIVKLSKLVREDDSSSHHLAGIDLRTAIENAAQGVVPADIIVEIEKKEGN